jgi:iron complex outermembrane receptor protein
MYMISRGLSTSVALAVFLVLVLGLTATPTRAQNSPGSSDSSSEDIAAIVVTARRVEERLQDVPISITVFNQEQLTKLDITTAADLAMFTPSLSVNTNFGIENSSFAIRGFVQDASTAPSVGTYFADVVAPRGPTQGTQAGDIAGMGAFFDLQNVQILKGPQGTLFGRNTTGGAVLFVPQRPTSEFGGYAEFSAGNYGMFREQGAVNLPFSDTVRFRLAVDHEKRDGYLDNISGIGPDNFNNVDYTAARAGLIVDITPNLENYTIASESYSSNNGTVQKLIACNPAGFNPVNPLLGFGNFIGVFSCGQLAAEAARGTSFYQLESAIPNPESIINQMQFINTTTWKASDTFDLKNILSYAQFRDFQTTPLFGTNWQLSTLPQPYPEIFFQGIPRNFTGVFAAPGLNTANQATYTEELRLQGSTANQRLTYQAGVYAEWSDPLGEVGNQSEQLAACGNPGTLSSCSDPIGSAFSAAFGFPVHVGVVNYTVGETTFRDQGLYTQESYSLTDQWKLTAGARYTWDSESNESTRIGYNFPVEPPYAGPATAACTDPNTVPDCSGSVHENSSAPTWLFGLDYKPVDELLLYAKYARGYRAGGIDVNAPEDHRTFEPEKVDNYELGLKSSFHGPVRGTFDADVFYNNFRNQQIQFGFEPSVNPVTQAPAPVAPTTAIINAGKSRIYGTEVDATLNPFPESTALRGLRFEINWTYLSTKIIQIAPISTTDPNYVPATSSTTAGSPLVLSPRNKYLVSTDYTLPISSNIGRISLGADFVHTDKQLSTYDYQNPMIVAEFGGNLGTLPATNLLNLNAMWESIFASTFDFSLFATNVTQDHYYLFVPGLDSAGAEFASLGEPRMYGARLRYRFGKGK